MSYFIKEDVLIFNIIENKNINIFWYGLILIRIGKYCWKKILKSNIYEVLVVILYVK